MELIPIIGDKHHFFDDGKIRESRHYIAEILELITPEEAKNIIIRRQAFNQHDKSLYDIWKNEVNDHRNTSTFKIYNGDLSVEPGTPWLYAEETDYFIKCSIPDYDDSEVWFVRHVNGGWFSLDTVNTWMSGKLMPIDFDWDDFINRIEI